LTQLSLEVGNPADTERTRTIEFLVDSGAIYLVVPAAVLRALKIKPIAAMASGSAGRM
jgi:hypothetical protein